MLGADPDGAPTLLQSYTKIRQFGVDAQVTAGSWLLKLEAIHRAGALQSVWAWRRTTSPRYSAGNTRCTR